MYDFFYFFTVYTFHRKVNKFEKLFVIPRENSIFEHFSFKRVIHIGGAFRLSSGMKIDSGNVLAKLKFCVSCQFSSGFT